eukprot:gene18199-biopygen6899
MGWHVGAGASAAPASSSDVPPPPGPAPTSASVSGALRPGRRRGSPPESLKLPGARLRRRWPAGVHDSPGAVQHIFGKIGFRSFQSCAELRPTSHEILPTTRGAVPPWGNACCSPEFC